MTVQAPFKCKQTHFISRLTLCASLHDPHTEQQLPANKQRFLERTAGHPLQRHRLSVHTFLDHFQLPSLQLLRQHNAIRGLGE